MKDVLIEDITTFAAVILGKVAEAFGLDGNCPQCVLPFLVDISNHG